MASRRTLAVVVASAITVGGVLGLASTTTSAGTGRLEGAIVGHVATTPSDGRYMVIDPVGGEMRPLGDAAVAVAKGALAADATHVVVACHPATLQTREDAASNHGVCTIDTTSGSRRLVVDAAVPVQHPTPSPDGRSIVFAAGAGADHGLKIVPATGGEVASLCNGFCPLFRFSDIAWAPDGSRVAFVATTPGSGGHLPQIYTVTVGESDYTRLTSSRGFDADPAWSPDGRRIAFASSRTGDTELWLMNADGTDPRQLTNRPGVDLSPSWSPDGRHLVYTRHVDASWDLATIAVAGGRGVPLTHDGEHETAPRWLATADHLV